jgi:hypothetical protein
MNSDDAFNLNHVTKFLTLDVEMIEENINTK